MSHPKTAPLPLWLLLLCLSLGWRGALAQAPTAPDWDAGAAALQPLVESRSLAGAVLLVADRGLVLVYMVQHAGWRDEEGKRGVDLFRQAAVRSFGKIY